MSLASFCDVLTAVAGNRQHRRTITALLIVYVDESKGDNISSVDIPIQRAAGTFGTVEVIWTSEQAAHNDLSPITGTVQFQQGQRVAFIEIRTLPDDVRIYVCNC